MCCNFNNLRTMKKAAFLVLMWVCLGAWPALADMGPKPQMTFGIRYEGDYAARFVRLVQLEYATADAVTPQDSLHDANHRGPEGLRCQTPEDCRSLAYGYEPYHRLMFVFTDDTLYSEVFRKSAFHSAYEVTVSKNGVAVHDVTPWYVREGDPYAFIRALVVTVVVELLALLLVLFIFKYPHKGRFLLAVLLANLISLPIFWFGIMGVLNSTAGWFVGEAFVLVFESLFVWYFMKKPSSFGRMFLLLFFLNFLSMLAGGAALFFMVLFS